MPKQGGELPEKIGNVPVTTRQPLSIAGIVHDPAFVEAIRRIVREELAAALKQAGK